MTDFHEKMLREGYALEFESLPPPSCLPNTQSARSKANELFIDQAIADHLAVGAIKEVNEQPYSFSPFK